MNDYRYTLEKYEGIETRYICPSCGKARVFSRYIDLDTKQYLADHVGRCNREVACGCHLRPKQYFSSIPVVNTGIASSFTGEDRKPINGPFLGTQRQTVRNAKPIYTNAAHPSSIPAEYFKMSLRAELQEENNFIKYMKTTRNDWRRFITLYYVGTGRTWDGATVFWQIDKNGVVRSGKIILYNPETCKRVKEPYPHVTWVHSRLIKEGIIEKFNLDQCLFGEHLLHQPNKPVGIVESKKTAIASAYLPELNWMAVGSLNGLNEKMLDVDQLSYTRTSGV